MDTEQIRTRGEDSRLVVVIKQFTRINSSGLDGPSWIEGLAQHSLADGRAVNVEGNGFQVTASGERLTRI